MTTLNRLIPLAILVGFVGTSAGCIIAPDGEHDRGGHEHDADRGDRHCDDHDEHCRDH